MRRLILAGVMFIAASEVAVADCKPVKSKFDDYGVTALGAASVAFMDAHARRLPTCNLAADASCEFRDKDGIWYYLAEGTVEQKRVDVLRLVGGRKLPFGLTPKDSDRTVSAKLQLGVVTYIWHDGPRAEPGYYTTGFCYLNDKGEAFAMEVGFDGGHHLSYYKTFVQSARD